MFVPIDHLHSTCHLFHCKRWYFMFYFSIQALHHQFHWHYIQCFQFTIENPNLYFLTVPSVPNWKATSEFTYDLVLPSSSNAFTTSLFLSLLNMTGIVLTATCESLSETVDNVWSPGPSPCIIWFDLGASCPLAPSPLLFVGSSFFWKCNNLWWPLSQSCTPHFLL